MGTRSARSAGAIVLAIAACKLLLYFYTGRHYGYFVDELYYLACSRHLDWGYVDQPPLIALIAWMVRVSLGQSLWAIRLLPALAGAAEVLLTALMARELGGKRFAQALAAMSVLIAPGILGADGLFTMNAFEPLFWMGCAYLLIRIVKTGNTKLWIWFGVLAGFGLENKYSMLIFGAGLVLGLLLSSERPLLSNRWLWMGGAIAFLIFVPNLIWNIQHHFPFLEVQANIRASGRDVPHGWQCLRWPRCWRARNKPKPSSATGATAKHCSNMLWRLTRIITSRIAATVATSATTVNWNGRESNVSALSKSLLTTLWATSSSVTSWRNKATKKRL